MKAPQYEVKPVAEGTWGAVQIVTAYVLIQFGVEQYAAVAAGVLARPVLGYLLRFLPSPKVEA